jgi:chorismate-pyruvate lyase
VTTSGPSPLPQLLRDNHETVTHLLEELTGEPLVADVIRQFSSPAEDGNALDVETGQSVTHRIAWLRGGVTLAPYVYAESLFVPARLPAAAGLRLERTSDPIGRVLADHGLAHLREDLPAAGPGTPGALDGALLGAAAGPSAVVWFRSYRLAIDGLPVFAISEWFLRAVQDALERATPV